LKQKKNKKNILLCLPALSFGGAETQAFLLAKGLKKHYNVIMLGFNKAEKLPAELDKEGIEWVLYHFDFGIFSKTSLKKHASLIRFALFLRKLKVDVIIPYTIYPNIICNIAGYLAGIKLRFWNQRSIDSVGLSRLEKMAARLNPVVVSNSKAGIDVLKKRWKKPGYDMKHIKNGAMRISPVMTGLQWKKELGINPGEMVLLQVANYFPEKDHYTILKSVRSLIDKGYNNFKLIFIGRSSTKHAQKTVKADAFDLKLQEYVIFIDNSDDVPGLIDASDICILSSRSEGCPNAVLEYMLMKKPVVGTNIAGIVEILGDDYRFLFNPGNENMLTNQIINLMNNPEIRNRTGKENHDKVLENYNNERMIHQYLKLIENGS
jgi:glycosyltransferase involved in cell wall biosynthesis